MNYRLMLAVLLTAVPCSRRCFASREADGHWIVSVDDCKRMAEKAALWRPSGIRALPVRRVDLSAIEEKLAALKKAFEPAKNPEPGIGIQFENEPRSRIIAALLIKGPAEGKDIEIGDEVLQVNGRDVSNNLDIVSRVKHASAFTLTLLRGGKPRSVALEKQVPRYYPEDFIRQFHEEFESIKAALAILKEQAQADAIVGKGK